jgi:GDPmannose 4,6-dehydratase
LKTALITGITGQDGAYLARFLLDKGYMVHGVKRRSSMFNTQRVDGVYSDPHEVHRRFVLHYGDLTDSTNLIRIVQETRPDEIYNLGAQSHVQVSFETPEYTANADAVGALRLLEALRILGMTQSVRFYQASTSELFGKVRETPQRETTPFYPRSPYGVAKLYAYWITVNYREAYGIHASNGILFNHESPIRGETFVTRKITMGATRIREGLQDKLYLGNLDARRDWGFAGDFVVGMWQMVQADKPDDYVLATGEMHSVREFCLAVFNHLGLHLEFRGEGINEVGVDTETGKTVVAIDPRYFRATEVEQLVGDATKARETLGWHPRVTFPQLVAMMTDADVLALRRGEPFALDQSLEIMRAVLD